MKILKIAIKNLASLEGLNEIDFTAEPLKNAGLFAITGPTGAGKSTILDALCLALYAKTPRYASAKSQGINVIDISGNKINQGDEKSILRDGTSEGFAEVEFEAIDKQLYKAGWAIKRARNKITGNLQKEEVTLVNLSTGINLTEKKTETLLKIEKLVGLNFEQFTRTVLLAQGEFTAFLKAGSAEKATLLEKLTGTEQFSEISKIIYQKFKTAEEDYKTTLKSIDHIKLLDATTLEELEKDLTEKLKYIDENQFLLQNYEQEISWHKKMSELGKSVTIAKSNFELALEKNELASSRRVNLKKIEQVQQIAGKISSVNDLTKNIEEKSANHKLESMKAEDLKNTINEFKRKLIDSENNYQAKKYQLEQARPKIDEAKELDTILREKIEYKSKLENEIKDSKILHNENQSNLEKTTSELDRITNQIVIVNQYFSKYKQKESVFENHADIKNYLKNAAELLPQLEKMIHEQKTISDKILNDNQILLAEKQLAEKLTVEIEGYELAKKEFTEFFSTKLLNQLIDDKSFREKQISDLELTKNEFQLFQKAKKEFEKICAELNENEKDCELKKIELESVLDDLNLAQILKNESDNLLQKSRLIAAENVETLRAKLVEHEACPVCGSHEHPFVHSEPLADMLLEEIERKNRELTDKFIQCQKLNSTLDSNIANLSQRHNILLVQQKEKGDEYEIVKQNWEKNRFSKELSDKNEREVIDFIQLGIADNAGKLEEINEKINNLRLIENQLNSAKNNIEILNAELGKISLKINSLEINLKADNDKIISYSEQIFNFQNNLDKIKIELDTYFIEKEWFNNWKNNPEHFINAINQFATEWKNKLDSKTNLTLEEGKLIDKKQVLEKMFDTSKSSLNKKEEEFESFCESLSELQKKRADIFDGVPAEVFSKKLQAEIDTALETKELTDKTLNSKNNELVKINLSIDLTKKEIQDYTIKREALETEITDWIEQFKKKNQVNLDLEECKQLITINFDWIEHEKRELAQIEKNVTEAESALKERNSDLELHASNRISEKTQEILIELKDELKERISILNNQKNEISISLRVNEENKLKFAEIENQINEKNLIYTDWSKINEHIGSAEGNKFRHIAQEYTLDILLSYSNIQLEMLTKRYKIQRIPNTLGLQIIDKDMGDDIRTVFSLSGGESFLVSLALALGLSELSSNRLQVKSLFIDEGFGSLDPHTLNIAVDALERLEEQGRKVGVISHVQEMKERIPVQIKVDKQRSGKSRIEIENYSH